MNDIDEKIENIIKTKRVKLSQWDAIWHYSVLLYFFIIPIADLFKYLSGNASGMSFSLYLYLVIIILFATFSYIKWSQLNFKVYKVVRSPKQFKDSVNATALRLEWDIKVLSDRIAIATNYDLWKGGLQKITIVRHGNKVYINSMFDTDYGFTDILRVNHKNCQKFILNYKNSSNDIYLFKSMRKEMQEENKKIENEPEWSLINILKRMIAYSICFVIIAICAVAISENIYDFVMIPLLCIAFGYLALDIFLIIKKSMKSKG